VRFLSPVRSTQQGHRSRPASGSRCWRPRRRLSQCPCSWSARYHTALTPRGCRSPSRRLAMGLGSGRGSQRRPFRFGCFSRLGNATWGVRVCKGVACSARTRVARAKGAWRHRRHWSAMYAFNGCPCGRRAEGEHIRGARHPRRQLVDDLRPRRQRVDLGTHNQCRDPPSPRNTSPSCSTFRSGPEAQDRYRCPDRGVPGGLPATRRARTPAHIASVAAFCVPWWMAPRDDAATQPLRVAREYSTRRKLNALQ
jgi:hypothetical protein